MSITERKSEHLVLAMDAESQFDVQTGFADVRLAPEALPEFDMAEIDLSTEWLNHQLSAPIFVSGMTGGTQEAGEINRGIAAACQQVGIGMGLGSQRAMIEDPSCAESFQVRDVAPDICLAGNIGAAQLCEFSTDQVIGAAERVGASLLAIHLNAAQEAVQPFGDTNFRGVAAAIRRIAEESPFPVFIKEVGSGMTAETASRLGDLGIAGIDVAGAGGTSWPKIETQRSGEPSSVASHGLPTAWSILEVRQGFAGPILASGGIRSSQHVAKAIALGARGCSMAWPVLRAFRNAGTDGVVEYLETFIRDLRRLFFVHGARTVKQMMHTPTVLLGDTYAWAQQRQLIP